MNQQFDDHIKEQFSNYSPDVNPRIWENIIAERERRRPVGFWVSFFSNRNRLMLIGLLIAISTGGTLLYMNDGFDLLNTRKGSEALAKTGSETSSGKNSPVKTSLPDNNNSTTTSDISTTTPSSETISSPGIASSGNGDRVAEKNDLSVNVPGNNNSSNTGNKNHSSASAAKGKLKVGMSPGEADDAEKEKTSSAKNKPVKNKRFTGVGSVLNVTSESPGMLENDMNWGGTLLGRLTYDAEKASVDRKKKKHPLYINKVNFLPDCPSFEKNTAGNKKYLEIYAGPDYAFRSLTDTGNSAYLQKRKETAKFKSGFSAGIRYTRVFNNSMSLRGGVNYSQINEKFTLVQGGIIQVVYITNSAGDTIGSYTTNGTRYKKTMNRYRSIDIPVSVGYEIGNERIHANINAGVVVNLYSWQKGEVLDMNGNPVSITTGKSSSAYQFKTNAGVGFIGGVSLYYKLNDRLHLMAEPYFRYNFTSISKENMTLKQKYNTAGLRLGIRLDLK
jgi:hypothetical protein